MNKPSFLSKVLSNGVAALAVDGNTDGRWNSGRGSCASTAFDIRPWWAVDLGFATSVFEVVITNRIEKPGRPYDTINVY